MKCIPLVFLISWVPIAMAEDLVDWKFSPMQTEVYPGEPVALALEATSWKDLRERQYAEEGSQGNVVLPKGAFLSVSPLECEVHMAEVGGAREYHGALCSDYSDAQPIIILYPKLHDESEEKTRWVFRGEVLLNLWFLSIPFDPGDYRVAFRSINRDNRGYAFSVETHLRVLPNNAEKLKERFAGLGEGVEEGDPIAIGMIYLARSAYAVPYQIPCLAESPLVFTHKMLLDALCGVGTVESTQAIMDFIQKCEQHPHRGLRRDLIFDIPYGVRAIYKIRANGDVKLRELTEEFVKTRPFPEMPKGSSD